VQRLKREGRRPNASSGPSAAAAAPSKNEDELLASLFGDLNLDHNAKANTKDKAKADDVVPPHQAKKAIEMETSPPWYTKPGALANVKYSRPVAKAKPDSKTPASQDALSGTPAKRAPDSAKPETKPVTIDLLSSEDEEDEKVRVTPPQDKKRQEANAKKEELKRKMEELKRRKEALENAKRKQLQLRKPQQQQQQRPARDDSSDSESALMDDDEDSASRRRSSSSDSEDDAIDHRSTSVRTPPSGAGDGGGGSAATTPFIRTVKGAMIATPSPATPRRPTTTGNKENVAPCGVSGKPLPPTNRHRFSCHHVLVRSHTHSVRACVRVVLVRHRQLVPQAEGGADGAAVQGVQQTDL
jgi:hypothetical protein